MASLYGTIGPFNEAEETWAQYVEHLEQYFIGNDVKDDKKKAKILGKSISSYVAELCKLSEHCNFGETLEDMIRNHLVCGVKNESIQ